MMRLYKGKQVSPFLHPIDAAQWQALGWSVEKPKPKTNAIQTQKETPKEVETITRENRELELLGIYDDMGWSAIRAIASQYNIEKPDDGWDAAIPLILDAEFN